MIVIDRDVLEVGIGVATGPPPILLETVGTMAAPPHAEVVVLGTTLALVPAVPPALLHAHVIGTRVRGIKHAHAALFFSQKDNNRGGASMML